MSQRLVRTPDGKGRVATCEIMVMTGRVHDMILDSKQTGMLGEVVAEGGYYGMQTFDHHLLTHLQAGLITYHDAMRAATSPHDFKLMVAAAGPLPEPQTQPEPEPEPAAAPPMEATSVPAPAPPMEATIAPAPPPPVQATTVPAPAG